MNLDLIGFSAVVILSQAVYLTAHIALRQHGEEFVFMHEYCLN